jgi:voltage-gated sodium channel
MVRSIPPIASLALLTLLIMYVYAMVGWILFHEDDPANWGDLGQAMLSTFQMLTLENWPTLLDAGMEIHPASWIFFVSYVLLASFLVINILIAIIINSMEEVDVAERQEEREAALAHLEAGDTDEVTAVDRIEAIRGALDALEADLASGALARGAGDTAARRRIRGTKGGRARM